MSCENKNCENCENERNKILCKILDKNGKKTHLYYINFLNWKMQHNSFDDVMPEMEPYVEIFDYLTRDGKIVKCRTFLIECRIRTNSKIFNFLIFDRFYFYKKYRVYEFAEPVGKQRKLFCVAPVNDKNLNVELRSIDSQLY